MVGAAYNDGAWDLPGLTSSTAAQAGGAIGYAEAAALGISQFRGQSVDSTTVLVAYTFGGDTNLDGRVDFSDLLKLAQHYGQSDVAWIDGDVTHDGEVSFADLLVLAQTYGNMLAVSEADTLTKIAGQDFISQWDLALSLVPEPAGLSLLAAAGLLRRRR